MLRSIIKGIAEKAKAEASVGETRKSASDRRQRKKDKDVETRRYVSGVGLLAFFS